MAKSLTDLWQSLSRRIPGDLRHLGLPPLSVAGCRGNLPVVAGGQAEGIHVAEGEGRLAGVEGRLAVGVGSLAVPLRVITRMYLRLSP